MIRLGLQQACRRHAAWGTLLAGLSLTFGLAQTLHSEALDLDRRRLVQRAAEIKGVLDARLERSEMLLQNLGDYLTLGGGSRNEVFARWCYDNGLTINCPWVLGIAVATNGNEFTLPPGLSSSPSTWSTQEWTALESLANAHAIECNLALRSDAEGRRFLTDYDLRCAQTVRNPTNAATSRSRLAAAILDSSLTMSHQQVVMLETNTSPIIGTSFYLPLYRTGLAEFVAANPPHPRFLRSARWLHLSAVIVAPVDFTRLVLSAESDAADVGMEIYSSTNELTIATWLNRDRPSPRATDPAFASLLTHQETWRMYRQRFTLFFYPKPLFEAQSPHRLARTAGGAGLAITLLATALVGLMVRARNRQDTLISQVHEARDALAAAQRERDRISRDLHDGTIQALYSIQLGLGHTARRLRSEAGHVGTELSAVRRELDTVIAEIRQFITTDAAEGGQKPVDLGAVLQALTQRAAAGSGVRIQLSCDPQASGRVTTDQAVQLANIAREALSNSLRHAQPKTIDLALRWDRGTTVILRIADDGAGFSREAPARPGLGLSSMSARAQEAGGTLVVESTPGGGTVVMVRLPVDTGDPTNLDEQISPHGKS